MEPNIYVVVFEKIYENKSKEDPLLRYFIIDATKDEQSATVRQISLPFDNDPRIMEMNKKYSSCFSYFFDLGEVWVIRICYMNNIFEGSESVALHYVRRETLEIIHTEELTHLKTHLKNNYYAPHFPPFYHVEIEKETEFFKDFVLHFTTMIVPFSQREVSLHFLL